MKTKAKFRIGQKVKIARNLGKGMSHFPKNRLATIIEIKDYGEGWEYALDIPKYGACAWYFEGQLTP